MYLFQTNKRTLNLKKKKKKPSIIGFSFLCLLSSDINILLIHFTDVLSHTSKTEEQERKSTQPSFG